MTERPELQISCPNCNAQPGEPCTQPTDTGRVDVKRPHLARTAELATTYRD